MSDDLKPYDLTPSRMRADISKQEDLIKKLRQRVVVLNGKLSQIIHNQRHYLRHRAPKVLKNQRDRIRKSEQLLKKMAAIEKIQLRTSYGGEQRAHRVIFMCTANEARKLRAMVNIDFRQWNSRKKQPNTALHYSTSKARK